MCNFPNIQYDDRFQPLANRIGLPKSPQAMYTLLKNNGFVQLNFLENLNVHNMTDLENKIFEKISHYGGTDHELKEIFCLIHIWGGNSGRNVFIKNPDPDLREIIPHYRNLVNSCLKTVEPHDNNLNDALDAAQSYVNTIYDEILLFHNNVKGIGPSFLTKHTRFWLTKNNPRNPLPIYDSTFAVHIMQQNPRYNAQFRHIIPFWNCMINKAREEHISLLSLERQLFNFF